MLEVRNFLFGFTGLTAKNALILCEDFELGLLNPLED
jgi:hypothetical protein